MLHANDILSEEILKTRRIIVKFIVIISYINIVVNNFIRNSEETCIPKPGTK